MKNCEKCGKEILDEAVVCPECGCSVEQKKETKDDSTKAMVSFVFGILGLLIFAPLGIVAIVLAILSKDETEGELCKKAKTGLACGILALCIWVFRILLL